MLQRIVTDIITKLSQLRNTVEYEKICVTGSDVGPTRK